MEFIAMAEVVGVVNEELSEDACSRIIIGAAIEVHRHLGPGLLESAYEVALAHELGLRLLRVERQLCLPTIYKGVRLDDCYRIDLLVASRVIVEVKAVRQILPIHEVQLLNYLKFSGKKLGLLVNFHASTMKNGIRRVVLGL